MRLKPYIAAAATLGLLWAFPAAAEMAEELTLDGLPWEEHASLPGKAITTSEGEFTTRKVRTIDSEKVKSVLAAHPDQELIICIAGCKEGLEGHASILAQRPVTDRLKFAALLSAGVAGLRSLNAASGAKGDPGPGDAGANGQDAKASYEEVICLAGCNGPVGMVVWRGMRLIWISNERREDLKAALTSLAERLAAAEAQRAHGIGRTWLSIEARNELMNALGGEDRIARFAAGMMAARLAAKPSG